MIGFKTVLQPKLWATRLVNLTLVAWLFVSTNLLAQDNGSTETDQLAPLPTIKLPDITSETRFILSDDFYAPLPPEALLPAPLVEPPYPPEAERVIPEAAYRIDATLDSHSRASLGESFTEATLGAGLWGGVYADLALYRLDDDPSYSLAFSHAASDGFAFHEAGEGFYQRRTSVSGRLRGSPDRYSSWSLYGSFADEAVGLQGKSQFFYGVSLRQLRGQASYQRSFFSSLILRADLETAVTTRSLELAQANPTGLLAVSELSGLPRLSLEWEGPDHSLSLWGLYDFKGLFGSSLTSPDSERYAQAFSAGLAGQFSITEAMAFGAGFGWAHSAQLPMVFPFYLSAEAAIKEIVTLSLRGGLELERLSYNAAWESNPYLDPSNILGQDGHWFSRAKADFFILPGLDARIDAAWALSLPASGRLKMLAPQSDDFRHLYQFSIAGYHDLASSLSLRWRSGGAALSLAWQADWFDKPAAGEAQRLKLDLEYRERNDRFGGALVARAGIGPTGFELPFIDISAFVALTADLKLSAEASDLAAAYWGRSGRVIVGPYMDAGFQAAIKLRMSL